MKRLLCISIGVFFGLCLLDLMFLPMMLSMAVGTKDDALLKLLHNCIPVTVSDENIYLFVAWMSNDMVKV